MHFFTLEDWKIGFSIVGEAVKMTSSYHFWGVFILHLLFSPSHQSLFVWKKSGVIHFTSSFCSCFPSVGKSSLFIHLFMCFCFFFISIFVGATARHPQHTDDKRSARGRVQKEESTNIVPEEEKGGRRWGGERRESGINSSIWRSAGIITHRASIAFDNFS